MGVRDERIALLELGAVDRCHVSVGSQEPVLNMAEAPVCGRGIADGGQAPRRLVVGVDNRVGLVFPAPFLAEHGTKPVIPGDGMAPQAAQSHRAFPI
jgi:hypothetical protein